MNLKNKPPIFVPAQYRAEVEQLSKAALMDMVWDYARQLSMTPSDDAAALAEFRERREIIMTHRTNARAA